MNAECFTLSGSIKYWSRSFMTRDATDAITLKLAGLVLFFLLSVADLCLTQVLIEYGHGRIYEGNPIARACLQSYGWTGLAFFKCSTVLVVVSSVLIISQRRPALAGGVLTFACLAVGMVAIHSEFLLGRLHAIV